MSNFSVPLKAFTGRALGVLLLAPISALSVEPRPAVVPGEGTVSVLPISMIEPETRNTVRLRDSLRQSIDDDVEANKPYRLSVEERHRLREQLRGAPGHIKLPK